MIQRKLLASSSALARQRLSGASTRFLSSSSPPLDQLEYPLRTEAPIVTRTTAAEAASSASSEKHPKNKLRTTTDPFDDSNTIDVGQRQSILSQQQKTISTKLDKKLHAIQTVPPSHVPPNLPHSSLTVPHTLTTTLSNGIRVASQETYGQVCTIGLLVDVGSRHETKNEVGCNHLLELLAFRSTKFQSSVEITSRMDELGGVTFAASSREQMMYCIDILRPNVREAMKLLRDTVMYPKLEDGLYSEVEEVKRIVEYQTMDMLPEIALAEGLQIAGYGVIGNGGEVQQLGKPHFCPLEALPNLNAQTINDFRNEHLLNPSGMVIAGAGIGHDELVLLSNEFFSEISGGGNPNEANRTVPSAYTGGEFRFQSPTIDGFTRVALAFELGGWHSDDLVPTCVLQTLLGGGNSFSAGGPGKGMYSRLYREVLNQYYWAERAEAFTSFHSESGLLGISGSSIPNKSRDMTRVLAEHFYKLAHFYVTDEELDRARNMLKCNVLTQLESRLVLFEDIGRQILTYGKREDTASMCRKIDEVTKDDIREIARRVIAKPPTLSTVGDDVSKVPSHEEIASWMK